MCKFIVERTSRILVAFLSLSLSQTVLAQETVQFDEFANITIVVPPEAAKLHEGNIVVEEIVEEAGDRKQNQEKELVRDESEEKLSFRLPRGKYKLQVNGKEYPITVENLRDQEIRIDDAARLRVEFPMGAAEGANGSGVREGAEVRIKRGRETVATFETSEARTQEVFSTLPAGEYTVEITEWGKRGASYNVTCPPGKTTNLSLGFAEIVPPPSLVADVGPVARLHIRAADGTVFNAFEATRGNTMAYLLRSGTYALVATFPDGTTEERSFVVQKNKRRIVTPEFTDRLHTVVMAEQNAATHNRGEQKVGIGFLPAPDWPHRRRERVEHRVAIGALDGSMTTPIEGVIRQTEVVYEESAEEGVSRRSRPIRFFAGTPQRGTFVAYDSLSVVPLDVSQPRTRVIDVPVYPVNVRELESGASRFEASLYRVADSARALATGNVRQRPGARSQRTFLEEHLEGGRPERDYLAYVDKGEATREERAAGQRDPYKVGGEAPATVSFVGEGNSVRFDSIPNGEVATHDTVTIVIGGTTGRCRFFY